MAAAVFLAAASCNRNETIEAGKLPEIILDDASGVYQVKAGAELTIAPKYNNAENATFSWTSGGATIATTPALTKRWNDAGRFYVTLTVTTKSGSASEEILVLVSELTPPVISLPFAGEGITMAVGTEYVIAPQIKNSDVAGFGVAWSINGADAGNGTQLLFKAGSVGTYDIKVVATNNDGSDSRSFRITVVESLPVELSFPSPSYLQSSTVRYTFPGRPVYLSPVTGENEPSDYAWSVDGEAAGDGSKCFVFTPEKPGKYNIAVTADGSVTASVEVVCVDATEDSRYRAASAASSANCVKVFEWIPAPGQFINERSVGGMTGDETTPALAAEWAEKRLAKEGFVSLGGFGGYIIIGFDHSIPSGESGYDFSVSSNSFLNSATAEGGSNEPGIIYVMQDVNGNGLPDDEWYELRGSETGKDGTLQDYAVTYTRPSASGMDVPWQDNRGATGCIDYLKSFHSQDSYYPAWIEADSYTLRGTRLEARTELTPGTGLWNNYAFDWGYADNQGSDIIQSTTGADGGESNTNGFHIRNAIHRDMSSVRLKYIDFIKIQTGVNSKAGILGEVSTEVCGAKDLHLGE